VALRITGGELRGRVLRAPKGRGVRPTSARVREAIFSILGQRLDSLRVLDLCAGAGSLGLEAASRGASHVVFVEQAREHLRVLRENTGVLDGVAQYEVRQGDARRVTGLLASQGESFDLVFLDPPYAGGLAEELLGCLDEKAEQILAADSVVVVETSSQTDLPLSVGVLECDSPRRYGDSHVWFYRAPQRTE